MRRESVNVWFGSSRVFQGGIAGIMPISCVLGYDETSDVESCQRSHHDESSVGDIAGCVVYGTSRP